MSHRINGRVFDMAKKLANQMRNLLADGNEDLPRYKCSGGIDEGLRDKEGLLSDDGWEEV